MRYFFLLVLFVITVDVTAQKKISVVEKDSTDAGKQDREYWVTLLNKICYPVVNNLAQGTLKKNMPVIESPTYRKEFNSKNVSHLEAVGRTMAGLAPWLALPDDNSSEGKIRTELRNKLVKGLSNMVNPSSPDYLNFRTENQPLVDAAYVAQAFLQAPVLWTSLDTITKQRFVTEFKALRRIKTIYNNWLLFAGMTETFLMSVGEQYDPVRIDIAWRKLKEWYVGDGWYQDGVSFAMDYYNSYVMHPMMVIMLQQMAEKKLMPQAEYELALKRMVRYADFLERMITPEGYFPPFGRSMTYRTGIFHALSQTALLHQLPQHIQPAQVRSGITLVMKHCFEVPGTFDSNDWLELGLAGHQPMIADYYTCTGSLYICSLGFMALGLPATDSFWSSPAADWTSKKAWSGQSFQKDYHVDY
jgi:hypothetical protein